MRYPKLVRLRQHFERPRIDDIPGTIQTELARLELSRRIRPGQSVALTAGSRGIANIHIVLREVVRFLRDRLQAKPFLVPAMGSHGGGTAEGQRAVIESYGITEEYVGAPIRASMDTVSLGQTPEGFPLYLDKHAAGADHIGIVARVKPHTSYHGPIESGLCKMMMIGLGKHTGAIHYHRLLLEEPYDKVVRTVARTILSKVSIAFGLGLVENAYDETAYIEAVPPEQFEPREEHMLALARRWLPRLPFHEADLLIVDEIGKEVSGSGMDTNVVGRKRAFKGGAPEGQPQMRFIFVRGLSKKTHGNATGIGLADFTTTRLVQSMNYRATVINCITSGYPEGANIPVHFDTDREVLEAALSCLGRRRPEDARILHICNTLQVEEVIVSEPCLWQERDGSAFEVIGSPFELTFDSAGNLQAV